MTDARGRIGQGCGKRLEHLGRVDAAGRVMRAVDQHGTRARTDGGRDAVDVEIERRGLQRESYGLAADREDEDLVEEPRRRQEENLVSRLDQRPQGDGNGGEAAVRHRHVGGIPRHPGPRGERLRHRALRCRLRELVGEPVLVLRLEVALQCLDVARQRHLLGIADREVRDVRIPVQPGVGPAEEREEGRNALAQPVTLTGGGGGHLESPGSRSEGSIPPQHCPTLCA